MLSFLAGKFDSLVLDIFIKSNFRIYCMASKIFVNLPVKDLNKSKDFFASLGFKFNPQFTDENAACMIIGENIFAMLLVEKFFKSFLPNKEICDTKRNAEALLAISVESRAKVDELMKIAIETGGKEYRTTQDYGWMYGRAFEDLDGHIWEVFFMDESKMPRK